MTAPATSPTDILTSGDVAALLKVDRKTVSRWAKAGKIPGIRTLGGHYRFRRGEVQVAIAEAQARQYTGGRP
jgi:excisionase family DNA binding protein